DAPAAESITTGETIVPIASAENEEKEGDKVVENANGQEEREKVIAYVLFKNGIEHGAGSEEEYVKFVEEWNISNPVEDTNKDNEIPVQVLQRGSLSASQHMPFALDPLSIVSS